MLAPDKAYAQNGVPFNQRPTEVESGLSEWNDVPLLKFGDR
jgi:hypothetical protein